MSDKKKTSGLDEFDFSGVLHWDNFEKMLSIYGDIFSGTAFEEPDENDLKQGMRLVSVFEVKPELLKDEKLMKDIGSTRDYSFLFKDGKQVSDLVFRRGGISSGYSKGKYCSLIVYRYFFKKPVKDKYYRSKSNHCLVDLDGNIVLEAKQFGEHPHYLKGIIACMDNWYYNLVTGEKIIAGDSSVDCEDYIFVQKKYDFDWYGGKEKPTGVYKIHFETGEVEYFK